MLQEVLRMDNEYAGQYPFISNFDDTRKTLGILSKHQN